MNTEDGGHAAAAVGALADRDHERAGDEYTRAGWRVLSEPRPGLGPFDADERGWVGEGLGSLATAAVAYRVAGRDGRATRRGVEGVAVARDLAATAGDPVRAACLVEFVGDFRVVGGVGDAADAYAEAAEAYRAAADAVGDPRGPATTPLFQAALGTVQQVARGPADGEIAVTWEDLHGADPADPGAFLAARPEFKRRRFPGLVERVVEDGRLAAPRGTTEYGNEAHRCPECGSRDVNWVGEDVLCLRCSARMIEA